jgi:glycosyltransferase involved in cell wall biosynthesis
MKFSLLLCTRNSQRLIEEVLFSVVNQTYRKNILEVIIVDYESQDNTIRLAEKIIVKTGIQFVSLKCVEAGKSAALVLGLDKAKGDYIVILDDDNVLFPEFISEASKILKYENIGCLGSMGVVDVNLHKPIWFEKYSSEYAIGLPNGGGATDWVWGAGCIINKKAWIDLTKKSFTFILSPKRMSSTMPIFMGGEDVELALAINLLGYSIISSDKLKFYHKFEQKRLNPNYLFENAKGVARSVPIHEIYRLYIYNEHIKLKYMIWTLKILRKLLGCIKNILKNFLIRDSIAQKYYWALFVGIWQGYKIFQPRYNSFNSKIGYLYEK